MDTRALNAEMDHHLAGEEAGNSRNGYGRKTVTTETGWIELEIPRDRQASFDPQLIAKYQRRFPGFDDKIASMYDRGMSARDPSSRQQPETRFAFDTAISGQSSSRRIRR